MLKGALIGCGFFAVNRPNAWRDTADRGGPAGIVAPCDGSPARLADVAARFGTGRTNRDAAELFLQERPDFIEISTTAPSRPPLVELAAARRVPVIGPKPLTPALEDGNPKTFAPVEAAYRSGVDEPRVSPGSLL